MRYLVNGHEAELTADPTVELQSVGDRLKVKGGGTALVRRSKGQVLVSYQGRTFTVARATAKGVQGEASGEIHAPIPGLIVEVFVKPGDTVKQGERLMVLEAMKMQQPMTAPFDGTVGAIHVEKGQQVTADALLAKVDREA